MENLLENIGKYSATFLSGKCGRKNMSWAKNKYRPIRFKLEVKQIARFVEEP